MNHVLDDCILIITQDEPIQVDRNLTGSSIRWSEGRYLWLVRLSTFKPLNHLTWHSGISILKDCLAPQRRLLLSEVKNWLTKWHVVHLRTRSNSADLVVDLILETCQSISSHGIILIFLRYLLIDVILLIFRVINWIFKWICWVRTLSAFLYHSILYFLEQVSDWRPQLGLLHKGRRWEGLTCWHVQH